MTLGERADSAAGKSRAQSGYPGGEEAGSIPAVCQRGGNDASVPDLEKLVKLSGVFGVSLDELVKESVPGLAAPAVASRRDGRGTSAPSATRLLGLLLLLASVLSWRRSEGTWEFYLPGFRPGSCVCCAGALLGLLRLAHGWHILSPGVLSFEEHVLSILWRYRNRTIGVLTVYHASSSAIHTYMLSYRRSCINTEIFMAFRASAI